MTKLPTLKEALWCAGALALWLVVTALFIGFRPEHVVLAVLIFALFFVSGVTRRLTIALVPFFIFGISYDWMNIVPNYMVNPVDVEGLYNTEKSLFGIAAGEALRLTPSELFALHNCAAMDFMAGIFFLL